MIFDCDGVLVDSEPIANRVLAERLRRIGLCRSPNPRSMRKVRRQDARPVPRARGGNPGARAAGALRRGLGRGRSLKRCATKRKPCAGSGRRAARHSRFPAAPRPTACRSASASRSMLPGCCPGFEGCVFTSADVARPKPAPDLFLHAATSMNVVPSDSVVADGHRGTGVSAARASGHARSWATLVSATSAAAALQRRGAIVFDSENRPELLDAHHHRSNVQ